VVQVGRRHPSITVARREPRRAPVYGGCCPQWDLRVKTGVSGGWDDTYPAGIAYQWIDITGLN
jgi:hypothetical protein